MGAGLLFLVAVATVVVLVARRVNARPGGAPSDGRAVRRVFQYLMLFALLVVVALGVSGLLGRAIATDVLLAGDRAGLARELAFTVVGGPLLVGLAVWSRRKFLEVPGEVRSLGWAGYVTVAALTSLLVTVVALHRVLLWVAGLERYDGTALARLAVWGGVWAAHWWLGSHLTPPDRSRAHLLLGSLLGLLVAATGVAGLLAGALRVLWGLDGGSSLVGTDDRMLQGVVTLVVGAPVWYLYWVRTAARLARSPLWLAYVLLAGAAGGLVTAVVSASLLVYSVLVWLAGEPGAVTASEHFEGAPAATAATVAGALVWWYHRSALRATGDTGRDEVRRVYDYLMAVIGLVAASVGLVLVLAALVEAATGTALVGGQSLNTLLAAATLLAVGGPVWWLHWRRAQAAGVATPVEELTSMTRRLYLFVLCGVAGVAAVIALIVGVYLLFRDLVEGVAGAETVRSMRSALGVLLTTAAVASYHWSVYRGDRERAPALLEEHGPRFVLLVGPADPRIARDVAGRTRGRVQVWSREDTEPAAWSLDEVMTALGESPAPEVMVLSEPGGLRAIPVRRS